MGERPRPGWLRTPGGSGRRGYTFGPITVPTDHVFRMGDNRDQSADSRFGSDALALGGPVPIETRAGRAECVAHRFDGEGSSINPLAYLGARRWDRSGTSLRPKRTA